MITLQDALVRLAEFLPGLRQAVSELADVMPSLRNAIDQRAETVPRLAYRADELARALGVSRETLDRERTAGRVPKPDMYMGKMPLCAPRRSATGWHNRPPAGEGDVISTARDVWLARRLVAVDTPVNGELALASDGFRPLAELLAATPFTARGPMFDAILAGREDRDAIVRAMTDVNPTGPPPGPDAAPPASDWLPLRLETLPPVEPFPVDVLPDPAARLAEQGALAIGCPPDFLGVAMLAVAGGTIGRSVRLVLKQDYFAGATIFAGIVGPPSDGKTPALKAVAAAVRAIDDELAAEHEQALERWRADADTPGPEAGRKRRPPPPPKPRRIDIDDATMEVLPVILADNPRGLVMIRDELSALILGLNQYKGGKGNDRANLLKIWSGDRIVKDRVNHENNAPIRCPHPALSIVGGLTPDMLGDLADPRGRADGFIDRFLFTCPEPLPVAPWSDRGIPDDVADGWRSLIVQLWTRPLNFKDGRSVPHVATFTPEGEARWVERYNEHSAEMNATDFPSFLQGPWGKFREYAARLTLILTLMHHAADPTADALIVPTVGPLRVDDAWRLIAYFKSHARRVHTAIACGPDTGETRAAKAIVAWIRDQRRSSFTESDIKQARRWISDEDLADALPYLSARNAIRPGPVPPQPGPKGGRRLSPSYDVHPGLLVTKNPENPKNPTHGLGF